MDAGRGVTHADGVAALSVCRGTWHAGGGHASLPSCRRRCRRRPHCRHHHLQGGGCEVGKKTAGLTDPPPPPPPALLVGARACVVDHDEGAAGGARTGCQEACGVRRGAGRRPPLTVVAVVGAGPRACVRGRRGASHGWSALLDRRGASTTARATQRRWLALPSARPSHTPSLSYTSYSRRSLWLAIWFAADEWSWQAGCPRD